MFTLMGSADGLFTVDIETRRLADVGHPYLDLLDGKITTGASDVSFLPGCG